MNATGKRHLLSLGLLFTIALLAGCVEAPQAAAKKEKPEPILGKKTQEIGEWDPEAGRKLREDGGEKTNIVNYPLQGAATAIHGVAKIQVQHALTLFNATEGRYPKSHEEFMEKVIKANGIQLPEPVTSAEYQYDVENHELLVVEKQK